MADPHPSLHTLLLLSDSALPLGSFAFSSGLESFLAHNKDHKTPNNNNNNNNVNRTGSLSKLQSFELFLHNSLANVASTTLPYVITAYTSPGKLEVLDNDFDASTPCTVARRASVSQGRALLAVWERALSSSVAPNDPTHAADAARHLSAFAAAVKSPKTQTTTTSDPFDFPLNAHFPPLFGTTCAALNLPKQETAYLFLLNHAKALLSAAVRASVLGPYQSQALLAGEKLRGCMARKCGEVSEDAACAAVTVPVMDLWMGRHELLYSRIFNS